jgi:hypothetical protein
MSTGHCFALLRAAFARVGAPLAVIHVMFAAFLAALSAYLSAQPAELFGELRVTRHEPRSQHANVRAIPVEPDAPLHHFNFVLLQAGGRAVFAFLSALQARLDTTSIFFVSHIFLPPFFKEGRLALSHFNPQIF